METRASHILVGAFMLVLIVGAFAFVIWLARLDVGITYDRYRIYFETDVSGLSEGSAVAYRGIRVGEVTRIRIDPDNVERIQVDVQIDEAVPIKTDSYASLELQGITGVNIVQISGGTQAAPALEPAPGENVAVIPARQSGLSEFIDSAPALLENLITLSSRFNDLLRDDNREAFARTMGNIATVTDALADPETGVPDMVASISSAAESLDRLATTLERDAPVLIDHADQTLIQAQSTLATVDAEIGDTLQDVQRFSTAMAGAAEEIEGLVAENRQPIAEFANIGLFEATQALIELRSLVSRLSRVTLELERDPARFLFGDQSQGYELQ